MIRSTNLARQRGAALATALVLLTIMTILALTSMGTNTLQEKMASNAQEINRVFQTAETGLNLGLTDDTAFNTNNYLDDNGTFDPSDDTYAFTQSTTVGTGYTNTAEYNAWFRNKTAPKRGSGWDTSMAFYHFDLISRGSAQSGISTTLHAGAYQVGKK